MQFGFWDTFSSKYVILDREGAGGGRVEMWKRVPGRKVAKSLLGREGGEVTTDWNHSTEHAVSNVMPRLQQHATSQALRVTSICKRE